MEWFRLYPVRLLTDIRKHALTLEEQGFVVQLCAHVALFDGALSLDPESLRAEMRPPMTRKRFDVLWARCGAVAQEYLADISAQVAKHGHKSSVGRQAAQERWQRANGDASAHANADANTSRLADANADASAHANADAEKRRREKKRSPLPPKGAGPDPLFDRFWAAYPRHVGKAEALKAWAKLAPDELLLEVILAALAWQRHQRDWTKDDGAFIPYPATWLNQRRWEDERPFDLAEDDEDDAPLPPYNPVTRPIEGW